MWIKKIFFLLIKKKVYVEIQIKMENYTHSNSCVF